MENITNKNGFTFYGNFEKQEDKLIFSGGTVANNQPLVGLYIFDQWFLDGEIETEIIFEGDITQSICDVVFSFEPINYTMLTVGLGNSVQFCCIKYYDGFNKNWNMLACQGSLNQIIPNNPYKLKLIKTGSYIKVFVNDIYILGYILLFNNFHLFPRQIGFWCSSFGQIVIKNFKVKTNLAKAFVIMPFKSPFNEFYEKIIKKVCKDLNIEVKRGDEIISTNVVMQDIIQDINYSNFIIAEVSEINPNVYYELGYAHALNKPVILLAKKDTKIPFDISPYRIIYYDDNIIFKDELENKLKLYLKSMIGQ